MWQEFVRIKNQEYQNLIDKIIYRVDFCVNQTNLIGIKEPFVYMTDDFLFQTEKRKSIKRKEAPEVLMQAVGGSKSVLTQLPEYLPIKLYFYDIPGVKCAEREIVHEDLQNNKTMEFTIQINRRHLNDMLMKEEFGRASNPLSKSFST